MNLSILNNTKYENFSKLIVYNNLGQILLYKNSILNSNSWGLIPIDFLEEKKIKLHKLNIDLKNELETLKHEFKHKFKKKTINFYSYKITYPENLKSINLQKNFCWVDLIELIHLNIKNQILLNISKIVGIISNNLPKLKIIENFEKEFINFYNLKKKNERVFYSLKSPSGFSNKQIYLFKEIALIKNQPLMRICLHKNDDEKIHEMLMVHSRPQKVGPLRQKNHESLSYMSIDGEALIKTYSKDGKFIDSYKIHNSKKNYLRMCRLDSKITRTIESVSEYFIFLEICSGPFEDNHTIWV